VLNCKGKFFLLIEFVDNHQCKSGEFWVKLLNLLEKDQNPQNEIEQTFQRYNRHFNILEYELSISFLLIY